MLFLFLLFFTIWFISSLISLTGNRTGVPYPQPSTYPLSYRAIDINDVKIYLYISPQTLDQYWSTLVYSQPATTNLPKVAMFKHFSDPYIIDDRQYLATSGNIGPWFFGSYGLGNCWQRINFLALLRAKRSNFDQYGASQT